MNCASHLLHIYNSSAESTQLSGFELLSLARRLQNIDVAK